MRSGDLFSSPRWDAAGMGRAFLYRTERWPVPQVLPIDLYCPVKGYTREIDYRGPARLLREMKNDEPLFADRPGNHGPGQGGNVVIKSGAISTVAETDPLWLRAAESTTD